MEVTDAMKDYVEERAQKLPRYYDNVNSVEVVLDKEGDFAFAEVVVGAVRKNTFVASSRDEDMYAAIDQSFHKVIEQLRRHKEKVRDRQGPTHAEMADIERRRTSE